MQVFLLIGNDLKSAGLYASNLAKNLNAEMLEFPISKIDDTRNLINLIRLSFQKTTMVFCPNVHEASEEALNALLKSLEEPQENICFTLTAPSTKKVLPTIVSRCQIIKVPGSKHLELDGEIDKFMTLSMGEKLKYIDKFKDRTLAIEFVENTAYFMHRRLHQNEIKYSCNPEEIEEVLKTLSRLKANGNVNLQLSNLVIQLSKYGK